MLNPKIKLYCQLFIELLNDLTVIKPYDASLRLLIITVNGMIYYDSSSFVYTVIEYIKPYNTQILSKDEKFFIKDLISDFDDDTNSFIKDEIKKIHDIWNDPETSDESKENIWKYFILFVKLGNSIEKSTNKNSTDKNKINNTLINKG